MLTKRGRYLASGIFDGLGTQVLGASRLLTDLFSIAPAAHAESQAPVYAVGQERNESWETGRDTTAIPRRRG